jgi:hypothetical protein
MPEEVGHVVLHDALYHAQCHGFCDPRKLVKLASSCWPPESSMRSAKMHAENKAPTSCCPLVFRALRKRHMQGSGCGRDDMPHVSQPHSEVSEYVVQVCIQQHVQYSL